VERFAGRVAAVAATTGIRSISSKTLVVDAGMGGSGDDDGLAAGTFPSTASPAAGAVTVSAVAATGTSSPAPPSGGDEGPSPVSSCGSTPNALANRATVSPSGTRSPLSREATTVAVVPRLEASWPRDWPRASLRFLIFSPSWLKGTPGRVPKDIPRASFSRTGRCLRRAKAGLENRPEG
jgi:hypothetical protein